jgi:hypothetical protein
MIAYEKHAALLKKIMPAIVDEINKNQVPKLELDNPEFVNGESWVASTLADEFVEELSDAIFYALAKTDILK